MSLSGPGAKGCPGTSSATGNIPGLRHGGANGRWTLKEARVKRTGEGIFRRPAREVAAPLMEPGTRLVWEGARFAALGGEGWRGALCWEDK